MFIDDDDHRAGRDAEGCTQGHCSLMSCCCSNRKLQPCNGGKASAEGSDPRDDGPIGRSEARQRLKNGEEQRDWAVDRVRKHRESCMVRNGRRFQINAGQGAVVAAWGLLSCPVAGISRESHQQGGA